MEVLTNNPIANLPGPAFLAVYGIFAVTVLAMVWILIRGADPTRDQEVPEIPSEPDPHRFAYLRGGKAELFRTIVFELLHWGYLQKDEEKGWLSSTTRFVASKHGPDPNGLTPTERVVYDYFETPRDATKIFEAPFIKERGNDWGGDLEQWAEESRLIPSRSYDHSRYFAAAVGLMSLLVFGGYKIGIAVSRGKSNVGFLIVMMIISSVVLLLLSRRQRLSNLGKRYLEQVQALHRGLQSYRNERLEDGRPDPMLLTAMGLFGIAALQSTSYAYYHEIYKSSMYSSSGCGMGSCGSSCGGGGGCGGGGCGGCGGS